MKKMTTEEATKKLKEAWDAWEPKRVLTYRWIKLKWFCVSFADCLVRMSKEARGEVVDIAKRVSKKIITG